jgi:hypothetical protein
MLHSLRYARHVPSRGARRASPVKGKWLDLLHTLRFVRHVLRTHGIMQGAWALIFHWEAVGCEAAMEGAREDHLALMACEPTWSDYDHGYCGLCGRYTCEGCPGAMRIPAGPGAPAWQPW